VDLFAFPPVFQEIKKTEAHVEHWRVPVMPRKTGKRERQVPDITFRWRPEPNGAHGRPAQDLPKRKAR
jgi:hypothetical protein